MSCRDAPRWAHALLRLYPRAFRDERGAKMLDVVVADLRRAEGKGRGRRMATSVRCAADLVGGALRLRLRPVDGAVGTGLLRDLRQSARSLFAQPLVLTVIVLTLGLGVGLNTALFSVVDAAFIQQNLSGAGHPRQVGVGWTSGGLFQLLGVDAVLGWTYRPDDPMGTVVLDHGFWQDHFGGDASVLGSTVRLDGHPHTVVGVLPPDFHLELPRLGRSDVAVWKNPDDFWQNGPLWTAQRRRGGAVHASPGRAERRALLRRPRLVLGRLGVRRDGAHGAGRLRHRPRAPGGGGRPRSGDPLGERGHHGRPGGRPARVESRGPRPHGALLGCGGAPRVPRLVRGRRLQRPDENPALGIRLALGPPGPAPSA